MAGLILNLASLKAKANAVGVGTTATDSTPNLCPQKSAITGYVTNGSSTVSISGSWADNQLVEDACVAVGKTITSTATVYRNVSVGSQQGGGDIPAKGGSSYAYKVVTYEYATQTNFSDGTSSTGSYTSGSTTVNGSTVSANSLGTTTKARTKIGTSSKTQTVAGTSVSVSADIYQQANQAVSGYPTYRNVSVGSPSCGSDIPASGGSRRAAATVTYEEASVTVYTSNATSTGTYTSKSAVIYGGYVEASNLQTSFKTRTYIGSSTASGTVAGATRTASSLSIYQAANYITKITPTSSEGHSYHVSYDNIKAAGGSSSPTMWGRATYTFSSGSTVTSGSTTPFTNVTATFKRTYPYFSSNPSGAFSLNNNTGVVTASGHTGTSSRTAIIGAQLTVSIAYTGSYAGVFTACSAGTVTHYPPCTQNAYSPPTTGYNVSVSGPHPGTAPILYFYDGTTFRGQVHSRSSFDFTQHNTWSSTGTVNKIYVVENGNGLKYITITGTNGNTILAKTAISNYVYYNLTNGFSTSSYNNGTAIINIAYSNS